MTREKTSTETTCTPFLKHVAKDLLSRYGHDLSRLTVVFPNKRASLFLNEYLHDLSERPVWSPAYTTISELFRTHSPFTVADDIKLVCDLHKSFTACTGSDETLDQFYGWGEVMLSDFDDIDKSMADPHAIFTNLRDLHAYDNIDYLSDEQIAVLKHFFSGFSEHHNTKLKEKFLHLWSVFEDIYNHYNQYLRQQGITYEGALARSVVEDPDVDFGDTTYLFVGFNALQEVERQLFQRLKKDYQTAFYWDYDRYYLSKDTDNEAGASVQRYMSEFPNQLDDDDDEIYHNLQHPDRDKQIVFMGAPTDSIQARYVSQWLQDNSHRVKAGNRTAVVMCNESLLPTIIHCIPPAVSDINITTGFPLNQTAAASLITLLLELFQYGRAGGDKYRQKYVVSVLRHPYATFLSDQAPTLCETLLNEHRYYPSRSDLTLDEGLSLLFRDLSMTTVSTATYDANREVNRWLLDILRHVAFAAEQAQVKDPLTHESLFRAYTLVNRIQSLIEAGDLKADPTTYQRLLHQVIAATSVPFHGEPAVGLQVMGVLETRNLDFDHLLVLSCNEGNMPKGIDSPSFIPHSIRHAFHLSTIDNKVGLYAYYFFKMIQRASDVTIMYGNAVSNKNTGEKSRFMLQLLLESQLNIQRKAITSLQTPTIRQRVAIEKSEAVMRHLRALSLLSPTAINRYLRCPLQFFFNYIAGIKEPDNESDEMDNRQFGNIFHDASQMIYDAIVGFDRSQVNSKEVFNHIGHEINKSQIGYVLKSQVLIDRCLDQAIITNLFKNQDASKVPDLNGLQLINRKVIRHYLCQLLTLDYDLAPFTIRGLEGDVYAKVVVDTPDGTRLIQVGGRIDRLDEVTDGDGLSRIRVVDYKTGNHVPSGIKGIGDVFDPANIDKHSDYYLQTMLYAMIVSRSMKINPQGKEVSPALLFIQQAAGQQYDPVLTFDKIPIRDIRPYIDSFEENLQKVIAEILDPDKAFEPTPYRKRCSSCAYAALCGKHDIGSVEMQPT